MSYPSSSFSSSSRALAADTSNNPNPSRTWKACESCRKKKIKCDGAVPCTPCNSRSLLCLYSDANDNAARQRRDAGQISQQCDRLDGLYERMEQMMARLSTAVEALQERPETGNQVPSLPPLGDLIHNPSLFDGTRTPMDVEPATGSAASNRSEFEYNPPTKSLAELANLVPDAGGIRRYVGGVTNTLAMDMIKDHAAKETTAFEMNEPSSHSLTSSFYGGNESRPLNIVCGRNCKSPPRYMSDVLVGLFFTRLNPMFPILHEPSFIAKYKDYLGTSGLGEQGPSPFRSVLFAVYASASNMLAIPRQNQDHNFAGIEYFERALGDNYQNFGYGGLEEVQCLAILALCTASWNRLTESWKLAGQAVRAAQDLGLHINFQDSKQDQIRSRVWYCVYTLDSLLSACLGRPMVVIETDYDCELPETTTLDETDGQTPTGLNTFSSRSPTATTTSMEHHSPNTTTTTMSTNSAEAATSHMAGFVALALACRFLDKINRSAQILLSNNSMARGDEGLDGAWSTPSKAYQAVVLETQLSEWVREKVPPSIKYAANKPEEYGGIPLAMCTLTFMLHALVVIELNLPFIETWDIHPSMFESVEVGTGGCVFKVITAARGIIQACEMVASHVPPSHYLTFCVQVVYLSGFIMLKAWRISRFQAARDEVLTCVERLVELGSVFPGSGEKAEVLRVLLDSV